MGKAKTQNEGILKCRGCQYGKLKSDLEEDGLDRYRVPDRKQYVHCSKRKIKVFPETRACSKSTDY